MIGFLLFFSYFSMKSRLIVRKMLYSSYIIDLCINSIKSYNSYSSLLYYNYRPISEIQAII